MKTAIKHSIQNNKVLKIVSLMLGYTTWLLISQHQIITDSVQVPISFYNIPQGISIKTDQENFTIKLKGRVCDLHACSSLSLHVDASELQPGQHRLCPCPEQLFLPNSVKLVSHHPLSLAITVSSQS